jgi:hypothetical protein
MLSLAFTVQRALLAFKLLWFALVGIGVAVSMYTMREAWIDYRFVRRCRNDEASLVQAWSSLRDQFVLLAFQAGVFWVRAWALMWPDPLELHFAWNWVTDGTLLTVLQMLLAYNSYLDGRDRRRIIRLLDAAKP